jgi:hypothetical protein
MGTHLPLQRHRDNPELLVLPVGFTVITGQHLAGLAQGRQAAAVAESADRAGAGARDDDG